MPTAPTSADAFLGVVQKSGLVNPELLRRHVMGLRALEAPPRSMQDFAQTLVAAGLLTDFHVKNMLRGRYKGFVVGKFKVLQPIGSGGMGTVYLCQHATMGHKVAMKILPAKATNDQVSVERFFREARAAAGLNHPNLVRAHDIDKQDNFYYLVMDFVEGVSLQDLVAKVGPLSPQRAAHYMSQAALGLQYIHNAGLAHRDIKPGNLLVDREGMLRILDLGLARYLDDRADKLTKQLDDHGILGTADYISPEQAVESHNVDNRTDIYSLGATFYFILTGRAPFEGASSVQKLMYHQTHEPVRMENISPDVPTAMADIVRKMMAKNPDDRYQNPGELVQALESWTQTPIDPPTDEEIPAIGAMGFGEGGSTTTNNYSGNTGASVSGGSMATRRLIKGPSSGSNNYSVTRSSRSQFGKSSRNGNTGLYATIGGLAIAAGIAAIFLFTPLGNKDSANGGNTIDSGKPGNRNQTAVKPLTAAKVFVVSSGREAQAATLSDAIKLCASGDKISVRGERLNEVVSIPAGFAGVIEGDTGKPGEKVVWDSPSVAGRPMLEIADCAPTLRNFRFDGKMQDDRGSFEDLISVSGKTPGFTLENCEAIGFRSAGVRFKDAAGTSESPILLKRVRFLCDSSAECAVSFDGRANGQIDIVECRFEGNFQSGCRLQSDLERVAFSRNRFYQMAEGFHFVGVAAKESIDVLIENNVFVELRSAFYFDAVPGFKRGKLTVRNNLFSNPTTHSPSYVSIIDGISTGLPDMKGKWIWTKEDSIAKGNGVAPGTWYFRKTFTLDELPNQAILDVGCDDGFKVWINGELIGASKWKHYTLRIRGFDVTDKLKPGSNLVAVEAINQPDAIAKSSNTAAALNLQIVDPATGKCYVETNATWKGAHDLFPDWMKPGYNDSGWDKPIFVWDSNRPWTYSVMETFLENKSKGLANPTWLQAEGNLRDDSWRESAPLFNSPRGSIAVNTLSTDASDDSRFLRYARNNPLYNLDFLPDGQCVGYPQD